MSFDIGLERSQLGRGGLFGDLSLYCLPRDISVYCLSLWIPRLK